MKLYTVATRIGFQEYKPDVNIKPMTLLEANLLADIARGNNIDAVTIRIGSK
jgi:hypothetical protein